MWNTIERFFVIIIYLQSNRIRKSTPASRTAHFCPFFSKDRVRSWTTWPVFKCFQPRTISAWSSLKHQNSNARSKQTSTHPDWSLSKVSSVLNEQSWLTSRQAVWSCSKGWGSSLCSSALRALEGSWSLFYPFWMSMWKSWVKGCFILPPRISLRRRQDTLLLDRNPKLFCSKWCSQCGSAWWETGNHLDSCKLRRTFF